MKSLRITRLSSVILTALMTLTAATALPAAAQHAAARTLAAKRVSVKTLHVQEAFQVFNSSTKRLVPFVVTDVLIERPGKIRAAIRRTTARHDAYFYLSNGKTEYNYIQANNSYTQNPWSTAAGSSTALGRAVAQIDLILTGVPLPTRDATRTVTTVVLDGRPRTLTTDTSATSRSRYWVDVQTHLPYRITTENAVSGGVWVLDTQTDFQHWGLNVPIAPRMFAWNAPKGAQYASTAQLPTPTQASGTALPVGAAAPDFAALTPDGKTVHLSDFHGQPVVLDFWATWCHPCQMSMPHLEHVYQQVKDKNVAVLAVCVWDQKKGYDQWVAQNIGTKYNFPVAFDPKGSTHGNIAGDLYHVNGIPTQFIIDKDGKIAAVNVGYDNGDTRLEAGLNTLGVDIPTETKSAETK